MRDDLLNTELLATFVRFALSARGLAPDIGDVAREAAARIGEEIDYRHEADHITRFAEMYQDHPFIRIPKVVLDLSTERVITMTYMKGLEWKAARNTSNQELRNTWAEVITRFHRSNIRFSNLMQADPHAGNYRFGNDGTVGFLDFGCVKVLTEPDRRNIVEMNRAAIEGRMHDVRNLMAEAGFFSLENPPSIQALRAWWSGILFDIGSPQQPVAYTPEMYNEIVKSCLSPGPGTVSMRVPRHFALLPRIHLAVGSVCASLRATLPARGIADDSDGVAEPCTLLGRLHHDWAREHGLSVRR